MKRRVRSFVRSNSFEETFSSRAVENNDLDRKTKLRALKVSQSVVSLVSRKGDNEIVFVCSGTIVKCEHQEEAGTFMNTILTSASILRPRSATVLTPDPDIKVNVYSSDESLFEAKVSSFNFHYNIAVLNFESEKPFPHATRKSIDDSVPITPKAKQGGSASFGLYPPKDSSLFTLCPGEEVIALGRHYLSYNLMAAPGAFSAGCYDFDCGELLKASCRISVCGIGGPLINRNGEVIGINFFHGLYTPFLPINIAYKCLEQLNHGRVCQPWVGMKVSGLHAISLNKLDRIILQFPDIKTGVMVEEIITGSPASSSGICLNDVIVQCRGQFLGSSSEFFGILLDKAGEPLELSVARPSVGRHFKVTVVPLEASSDRCNRWLVPDEERTPHFRRKLL